METTNNLFDDLVLRAFDSAAQAEASHGDDVEWYPMVSSDDNGIVLMGNGRQRAIMLPIVTDELTPTPYANYSRGLAAMIVSDITVADNYAVDRKVSAGLVRFSTEIGYCGNPFATGISRVVTIAQQEFSNEKRDIQLDDLDHLPEYSHEDNVYVWSLSKLRSLQIDSSRLTCAFVAVWDYQNNDVRIGVATSGLNFDRELSIYYLS